MTRYGYDEAFRLASVATDFDGAGQEIDFGYDSGGRLTSLLRSSGEGFETSSTQIETAYTYDSGGRVTAIAGQRGDILLFERYLKK